MNMPTPLQRRACFPVYCGVIALAWMFMSAGCSRREPEGQPSAQTKSDTQTLVDGITGRTAVQAGAKARETLETVNTTRESDMKELDTF